MKFSLVIQASPFSHQSTATAFRFAQTLLDEGHELFRVFFYAEATLIANNQICSPQGETDLPQQWQTLAEEHQLDLVVCIAAAVKRGVIDDNEAKRYEKASGNLRETFELSGLGQLAEAIAISDRVVTFGA